MRTFLWFFFILYEKNQINFWKNNFITAKQFSILINLSADCYLKSLFFFLMFRINFYAKMVSSNSHIYNKQVD